MSRTITPQPVSRASAAAYDLRHLALIGAQSAALPPGAPASTRRALAVLAWSLRNSFQVGPPVDPSLLEMIADTINAPTLIWPASRARGGGRFALAAPALWGVWLVRQRLDGALNAVAGFETRRAVAAAMQAANDLQAALRSEIGEPYCRKRGAPAPTTLRRLVAEFQARVDALPPFVAKAALAPPLPFASAPGAANDNRIRGAAS